MKNIKTIAKQFPTTLLLLTALAGCGGPIISADLLTCCEIDGVYSFQSSADCKKQSGNVAPANECKQQTEVCCMSADGSVATVPNDECKPANIVADKQCSEDVCCRLQDGTIVTLAAEDCEPFNILPDQQCEIEVCCLDAAGLVSTVPESECSPNNVVSDDECAMDVCCIDADGNASTVASSACDPANVVSDTECEEQVCCMEADGSVATVPASACDPANTVPDDKCSEEICCRLPDGTFTTAPATDCSPTDIAPQQMCETEVCCLDPTTATTSTVPSSECDPANVVADDQCVAQEECCKTASGSLFVPAGECDPAQIQPAEMCIEDVCCDTATGPQTVPANECDPAFVVSADLCEPTECVKFRAVDMGSLPYTTTSGDTLQSVSSIGIYPASPSWGATCLDVPAGAQRSFAAVGYDATLTFAAPVSSLYILRFHGQVGDDLIVPASSLTPTFCGANAYNDVTEVNLNTPSTTVTVQDISTGGGSGYSVLLAECIEWAPAG